MQIALAQINPIVGDLAGNGAKICSAILRARREGAQLVVFPELALCGCHPFDLLHDKDFFERCAAQLQTIASKCLGISAIVGVPLWGDFEEEFVANYLNSSDLGIWFKADSSGINDEPKFANCAAVGNFGFKKLYNAALVLSNGKVQSVHYQHDTFAPLASDAGNIGGYFAQSRQKPGLATIGGERLAIGIGLDFNGLPEAHVASSATTAADVARTEPHSRSLVEQLVDLKPDLLVNICASTFCNDTEVVKQATLCKIAARAEVPIVQVNLVGGNANLIFPGNSLIINNKGQLVGSLKSFEEDFGLCNSKALSNNALSAKRVNAVAVSNSFNINNIPLLNDDETRIARIHDALVMGIAHYFGKLGFSKAAVGLSGGIDSALVLVLLQRALGSKNLHVLLMPSQYSSQHSVSDALALAQTLGVDYHIVPIEPVYQSFTQQLAPVFGNAPVDVAEENIQARIRGTLMMALSNKFGHLVLNTTNKSELAVGYGTLYGDMNGALSPLGDVYKTDVYRLARFVNRRQIIIPQNTIDKPPSAELRPDQKDSDSLPPYDVLDPILYAHIELGMNVQQIVSQGFNAQVVERVVKMVVRSEYKRLQAPPILGVSSRPLVTGRRMPVVAKWERG